MPKTGNLHKNRFTMRLFVVLAAGILLLAFSVTGSTAGTSAEPDDVKDSEIFINIRAHASVQSEMTYLGDIAEISVPGFFKDDVAAMEICRSPRPGEIKVLERRQIESVFRTSRGILEKAVIQIPDRVYIKQDSQELTQEMVLQQLEDWVAGQMGEKEVALDKTRVSGLEVYPAGELTLVFSGDLPEQGGRLSITADVMIEEKSCDRLRIYGWLDVFEDILCAAQDIARGQELTASDGISCRMNLSRLRGNHAAELSDISGKEAKTGFKKGDAIRLDLLEIPPVIQKGDRVRIIVEKENLVIAATGISRENGYMDDVIQVENTSSGKLIRGFVKGRSIVQVAY